MRLMRRNVRGYHHRRGHCRVDYRLTSSTLDRDGRSVSLKFRIIECAAMLGRVAPAVGIVAASGGGGSGDRLPSVRRERRRAYAAHGHCYRHSRPERVGGTDKKVLGRGAERASEPPPPFRRRAGGTAERERTYTSSDVHSPRCQRPPLSHSTHGEAG